MVENFQDFCPPSQRSMQFLLEEFGASTFSQLFRKCLLSSGLKDMVLNLPTIVNQFLPYNIVVIKHGELPYPCTLNQI